MNTFRRLGILWTGFLFCASLAGAQTVQVAPIVPAVRVVPVAPVAPAVALRPMAAAPVLAAPVLAAPVALLPRIHAVNAASYRHQIAAQAAQAHIPQVRAAQAQTQATEGRALLQSLHDQTGRGYRARDYRDASDFLFSKADQVVRNGRRGIVDAYSGVFVPGSSTEGSDYPEHGDQNGDGFSDHQGMNVEHVWPQSFSSKQVPMRSDLHHLMGTFVHPNGMRGSYPFGEVRGSGSYQNEAGAKLGQGVFEPPNFTKGRVARAMLYFYTRYYDRNIYNGGFSQDHWNNKIEMFLRWNRDFPPTQEERSRNDLVEQYQGNRNPFVDDPSLADRIGAEAFRRISRYDNYSRQVTERLSEFRFPQ